MKTREEAEQEMKEFGWWYQHFQFPNGTRTGSGEEPGYDTGARWKFIEKYVPEDLRKRPGRQCGLLFHPDEAERRGKCIPVDPFVEFVRQAKLATKQFNVELTLINEDAHTYSLTTEERFDYEVLAVSVAKPYSLASSPEVISRAAAEETARS